MAQKQTKYIFVTGGVISGVGKGITSASVGAVLQAKGETVSIQKCDPYLNVDVGGLDPAEHGECFVTHDGAETDLDLGHYERFLDLELGRKNSTLSGRLFKQLLEDEQAGKFGGKTIQMLPHITNAIQDEILAAGKGSDVHIVEIGGTVGDYEGLVFIEAIREFSQKVGRENCLFLHVVYVPFIETSKEFKSKPAQNAISDLRGFGIMPDGIVARSENPAPESIKDKIALFSGIKKENIQLMPNASTVYDVPLILSQNGIHSLLSEFTQNFTEPNMSKWHTLADYDRKMGDSAVNIGIVARHLENDDTYMSIVEALKAATWQQNANLNTVWLDANNVSEEEISKLDGIIIPDTLSDDSLQGELIAAQYAFNYNVPFLGFGMGVQAAVEAALNRGGNDGKEAFYYPSDRPKNNDKNLRLGDYDTELAPNTKIRSIYGTDNITERHRHKNELSNNVIGDISKTGIIISGRSLSEDYADFIEAPGKKFYIGTQTSPQFKSRPDKPHPLFVEFIKSSK